MKENPSKAGAIECPMRHEIDQLHLMIKRFSINKFRPSFIKNQMLPKIKKLSVYSYKGVISPLKDVITDAGELALLITTIVATTDIIDLFFEIGFIFKLITTLHSLIKQIKEFSDFFCL